MILKLYFLWQYLINWVQQNKEREKPENIIHQWWSQIKELEGTGLCNRGAKPINNAKITIHLMEFLHGKEGPWPTLAHTWLRQCHPLPLPDEAQSKWRIILPWFHCIKATIERPL